MDSFQRKPADAFRAASGPRFAWQFRHGGPSFFLGSFSLSLAAPPADPPLRGQEAFGSSLKGIPPTVPSSRLEAPGKLARGYPPNCKEEGNASDGMQGADQLLLHSEAVGWIATSLHSRARQQWIRRTANRAKYHFTATRNSR